MTLMFYKSFKTTAEDVSKQTGVCRKSLANLPNGKVKTVHTAQVVLDYLDEFTTSTYKSEVKKTKQEIMQILLGINEAWDNYLENQEQLKNYYKKYGIEKKERCMTPVTIESVLKDVLFELKKEKGG